jgi:RimJ/RimL family protein N-acetyltransferase
MNEERCADPSSAGKGEMAILGTPVAPRIETPRLILRGWRPHDFEPYAALLGDGASARFITRGGRPYGEREAYAEMLFLVGHWQMLGHGMFVLEEQASGEFLGRVGTLNPRGWPAVEIAWALVPEARGKGYATEAATAAINWFMEGFPCDRLVSIIDPRNVESQRVATRLGEACTAEEFTPFLDPCEVWELPREAWLQR